ncbi:alpha/beta hydrolase [Actinoplanes sp. NPDC051470]|uniref:alpha/beta hydrolase n=1 Tax=Actinoplanes sp. NPDC051470 TaxID=3157224 RepID=UPI003446A11B
MPFFALLLTLVSLVAPPASSSSLSWGACGDDQLGKALTQAGATCATLTVPVDYQRPSAGSVKVAITKIKATDPAHRRGALLVNPGGPGASGLELAAFAPQLFPELLAQYDVIGMDPRFTGRSEAIECDWKTDTFVRSAGPDRRSYDRSVALMRTLAAGCAGDTGRLPHATTRNTARDIDRLRIALGEPKINYLGFSYGTYLGAVYLQMFGAHAGRFVLDSAVDPAVYGPSLFSRNAPAMRDALVRWAASAATRDDTYHLGATVPAVLATVDRLHQVRQVGSYRVDESLLPAYFFSRLAQPDYETISTELTFFGKTGALPESLEAFLRGFYTGVGNPSDRYGTPILCADRPASRDTDSYYRDIAAHRRAEPFFGPLTRNISPCAFWPVRGTEPPTDLRNDRPVLVVGADHDPITPYPGQLAMRQRLTGSSSVTVQGVYRHTVYKVAGSACLDHLVTSYLLGSSVPRSSICPPPT